MHRHHAHLNIFRLFSLRCKTVLVPGDTIGVALKSKFPYVAAYADKEGFRLDDLSKFIVIVAWGINLSHSFPGKFVPHIHNLVIM